MGGGEDPEGFHNQVQIFVAIIIGTLTAITQYFKYKNTAKDFFYKKIALPTVIALVISMYALAFGAVLITIKKELVS